MSAVSAVRYRWLQTGGPWTEATDLAEVEWTDIDADLVPVNCPLNVEKDSGPHPNALKFQIRAAGAVSPPGDGSYGADNIAAVATRRRPDGTTGDMYYPLVGSANTLREFYLVQLMDAASNGAEDKAAGTSVFVGLVTEMELRSAARQGDVWDVEVSEIARWHMEKISVYGMALRRYSQADNKWQVNALPVFNAEGRPDQHLNDSGIQQERFLNENYNSVDGAPIDAVFYAGYWRLGEMLNYLRREYNQAGGNGAISTANYLAWAEADPGVKWDFLFTDATSGDDQVAKEFALGGMTLAKAVDHIITRAGRFDWTCEWNPTTFKYDLLIFDSMAGDGATAKTYTRGTLAGDVGSTPPEILSMDLRYSWDRALTRIKPLGGKKRWEFTADTTAATLKQGWTAAQKTAYDADKANGHKYPSVYGRYVVADAIDWSAVFGHANFLSGRRPVFPHILSTAQNADADAADVPTNLQIHVWRYKGETWEPAPDGVACHVKRLDGSIHITGQAKGEDCRWGENGTDTAYPIRVTIAVEDDARLTSAAAVEDKPTGWPTIEACVDAHEYEYSERKGAYLPNDGSGHPVLDNPAATGMLNAVLRNDQDRLTAAATRTLKAQSKPSLSGSLTIKELDWTLKPGQLVGALTGGGARGTITINAVIHAISYNMAEGQESMQLTLGGDSAL